MGRKAGCGTEEPGRAHQGMEEESVVQEGEGILEGCRMGVTEMSLQRMQARPAVQGAGHTVLSQASKGVRKWSVIQSHFGTLYLMVQWRAPGREWDLREVILIIVDMYELN